MEFKETPFGTEIVGLKEAINAVGNEGSKLLLRESIWQGIVDPELRSIVIASNRREITSGMVAEAEWVSECINKLIWDVVLKFRDIYDEAWAYPLPTQPLNYHDCGR